jgi:hypothetical protein
MFEFDDYLNVVLLVIVIIAIGTIMCYRKMQKTNKKHKANHNPTVHPSQIN